MPDKAARTKVQVRGILFGLLFVSHFLHVYALKIVRSALLYIVTFDVNCFIDICFILSCTKEKAFLKLLLILPFRNLMSEI